MPSTATAGPAFFRAAARGEREGGGLVCEIAAACLWWGRWEDVRLHGAGWGCWGNGTRCALTTLSLSPSFSLSLLSFSSPSHARARQQSGRTKPGRGLLNAGVRDRGGAPSVVPPPHKSITIYPHKNKKVRKCEQCVETCGALGPHRALDVLS